MIEHTVKRSNQLRFRTRWEPIGFDGQRAFRNLQRAFDEAWVTHPDHRWEARYAFAGQAVRIRVVGRDLAEVTCRPFDHLLIDEADDTHSDLRIELWDESVTGIARPTDLASRLEDDLRERHDGGYGSILGSPQDRFIGCRQPQTATWFDRALHHVVGWAADATGLTLDERGKPLYFPLLLWHSDRDVQVIHAGLVARSGQGVLLAGRGGSGKTTAALACLIGGFDYLADDYVGLRSVGHHSFVGYSLYNSTWLLGNDLARFPQLAPQVIPREHSGRQKVLVLLSQVFPEQVVRDAEICVVALPRVVDSVESRIRSTSKRDALLALAPSSTIQIPVSSMQRLDTLARLVERVPCYWLELGSNLDSIPRCVEELLTKAGRL